jgi:hypothetical protein
LNFEPGTLNLVRVLLGFVWRRLTTKEDTKSTKKDSLTAKSWENKKFQIWAREPSGCPYQNHEIQEVLVYK